MATKTIPETASWARVSVPGGLPLGATAKKNELFVSSHHVHTHGRWKVGRAGERWVGQVGGVSLLEYLVIELC